MSVYIVYIMKKAPILHQNKRFVAKILQVYYNMLNIFSRTESPSSI